jgi:hypothetical protein
LKKHEITPQGHTEEQRNILAFKQGGVLCNPEIRISVFWALAFQKRAAERH